LKPVLCFIDDAAFELENFRAHAAGAFQRLEVVCASSFDEARQALDGRRPLCFLLDLYGGDENCQPALPDPGRLEELVAAPAPVAWLYQDMDQDGDPGERGNHFLRRLHSRIMAWQAAFDVACASLGQGAHYGLANLAAAREHRPWAACLAYSRKAQYQDAAEFMAAGGDGVLQKPQGADERAIAAATKEAAGELARVCGRAVDLRLARLAVPLALGRCLDGESLALAEALALAAAHLDTPPGQAPAIERAEAAKALEGLRLEKLDLAPDEVQTLLALKAWLNS